MGFSCGIIGLPNAGKSTLFNALTKAHASVANYPFTTIEPNIGVCEVRDERIDRLAEIVPHDKIIPTTLEFVDIAGLVKGSSKGEGLGNQFLSHILQVEAICYVVRCFEDENVSHQAGRINPIDDIEVVQTELILKDLEILGNFLNAASKKAKAGDKKTQVLIERLLKIKDGLEKGILANSIDGIVDILKEASLALLTSKPVFYVANIGEDDIKKEKDTVARLKEYVSKKGSELVLICARLEEELTNIEDVLERQQFADELGLKESALSKLVATGYRLLGLVTFFTTDSKIIQAWTVPQGTRAPQAAGRIHTDFEKGFIKVDVLRFDDLLVCKSEQVCRQRGLMRTEGKEYLIRDGDILHFKFART